jgi:hypothetical protein
MKQNAIMESELTEMTTIAFETSWV